jgi:hypothetical protein
MKYNVSYKNVPNSNSLSLPLLLHGSIIISEECVKDIVKAVHFQFIIQIQCE